MSALRYRKAIMLRCVIAIRTFFARLRWQLCIGRKTTYKYADARRKPTALTRRPLHRKCTRAFTTLRARAAFNKKINIAE